MLQQTRKIRFAIDNLEKGCLNLISEKLKKSHALRALQIWVSHLISIYGFAGEIWTEKGTIFDNLALQSTY